MSTVGVSARVLQTARGHKIARVRSPRRWTRRVASVLLVLIAALGVGVGTASAANAWSISDALDNFMCSPSAAFFAPSSVNSGAGALGVGVDTSPDSSFNKRDRTAYERYSIVGLTWTVAPGIEKKDAVNKDSSRVQVDDEKTDMRTSTEDCHQWIPTISTAIANGVLYIAALLVSVTGWIFTHAYDATWLDPLRAVVVGFIDGQDGHAGLRDSLYFEFNTLLIMFGAIYLGWKALVKHEVMAAAQDLWGLIGILAIGSWIMYSPSTVLSGVDSAVNAVSQVPLEILATQSIGTGSELCTVTPAQYQSSNSGGALEGEAEKTATTMLSAEQVTRSVSCSLWETYLFVPWAQGQFGGDYASMPDSLGEMTMGNGVNLGAGRDRVKNWALYQLDAQVLDPAEIGTSDAVQANRTQWYRVLDAMGSPSGAQDSARWQTWSAADGGGARIGTAFLALIAAAFGMVAIVYLSAQMLIQSVTLMFLLSVSPIFMLIAIYPPMRRAAYSWGEQVFGTMIQRIINALLIAVTVMLTGGLMVDADSNWGLKVLGIIIVSIGIIKFRGTLADMIGGFVNFGGGMDVGARAIEQGGQDTAKKTKGAIFGGAVGAVAGMAGVGKIAGAAGAGGATGMQKVRKVMKGTATAAVKGGAGGVARGVIAGDVSGYSALEIARQGGRSADREAAAMRAKDKKNSAKTFAAEQRSAQARMAEYERDWEANHGDPRWREAFKREHGFEPKNPDEYQFTGYGIPKGKQRPRDKFVPRPEDEIKRRREARQAREERSQQSASKAAPKPEGSGSSEKSQREDSLPRPKPSRDQGMPRPKKNNGGA